MQKDGLFIVLEGPEAAGKSSQISLLKEWFERQGREVVTTREPGGTELGEALRNLVKYSSGDDAPCDTAELFLFAAARAQHIEKLIKPAINQGKVVICDRFADSTTVYQGFGRGLPMSKIFAIHQQTFDIGMCPDLTVIFDIDLETIHERLRKRSGDAADRFDNQSDKFHKRIIHGFRELYETDIAKTYNRYLVDARKDIENVHDQITQLVLDTLIID